MTNEQAIWKYDPPMFGPPKIHEVPKGSKIVSMSQSTGCVYLRVPREVEETQRLILTIRGTGHSLGDAGTYLGLYHEGPYVWHIFADIVD